MQLAGSSWHLLLAFACLLWLDLDTLGRTIAKACLTVVFGKPLANELVTKHLSLFAGPRESG
ncbi:hypothetical protein MPNT_450009 [Candidatus Methylacidithermus pantelleriae]|uniref:Uncharacterized protein n=1 Tax=Candidatus Methylacidithermus pantelleriae TaxID=2744239 RepID=A0A8J2BME3_9BACT|nr:hypothetical protein MPNT_450009 [Candidatus Methylacidithermus pantelleriae]